MNGVLYVTTPDNVWALDAHDGREIWHYVWKTRGGTHIGNRGVGMWNNYLFFVTPDDYMMSLDATTGKERWSNEIVSFQQQYFLTIAPTVVDNHVLVGTGNDLDVPGFLMSFDPETGKEQWRTYMTPMNPGDPGLETWKNLDAARHGGGHPWVPGSFDPETRLYIIGTGNPTPAYTSAPRGEGLDNLYTCALLAIHVDTGKIAWHYQTSPHDTHDWDSAQTPVLVDGEINGQKRKLVLTAAGTATTSRSIASPASTSPPASSRQPANWAKGLNAKGQPVREPAKDHHIAGALVSGANVGRLELAAAGVQPGHGTLLRQRRRHVCDVLPLRNEPARRDRPRRQGRAAGRVTAASYLAAIDYKTGKTVWKHKYRTMNNTALGSGLLTTAGRLLFGGDVSGNLLAFDPAKGSILWHSAIGQVSNAPQTYMLDGKQYVLAAAGDTLYAFTLY